jgi:hypothetical protein
MPRQKIVAQLVPDGETLKRNVIDVRCVTNRKGAADTDQHAGYARVAGRFWHIAYCAVDSTRRLGTWRRVLLSLYDMQDILDQPRDLNVAIAEEVVAGL